MKSISKFNCFILNILFVILIFLSYNLNLIPTKYLAIVGGVLLFLILPINVKLLSRNTNIFSRIFFNLITLMISTLFCIGITYINTTSNFMKNLISDNLEEVTYDVVVKENSSYNKITDLKSSTIGYINTDKFHYLVKLKMLKDINYKDKKFQSVEKFTNSLLNEEVPALIIEDSYLKILKEEDETFTGIKTIKKYKVIVKRDKKDDKTEVGNSFLMYISGIDTYGDISTVSRSDVNILMAVNKKKKQILLISIPRDYYVKLHGTEGNKDKLTHAGIYGIDMSMSTINDLLNTNIDYYAKINFSTLTKCIDLVDGVDVYSDISFNPTSNPNLTINEGINHMNGEMALAFARERYIYKSGDRKRGENQQAIITALIEKITSPKYITKYKSILSSLDGTFETNMPYKGITGLVKEQIDNRTKWTISSISLDGTGSYEETYSMGNRKLYVMIPDENTIENAKINIDKILK